MKRRTRLNWILLATLLGGWLMAGPAPLLANQSTPIEQQLSQMTVEEKVGQIFVVAFVGHDTSPESDIAQLITDYKVGGVVLLASNSNFYNLPAGSTENVLDDTPTQVARLANALQQLALSEAGSGIPLFVAVDQEGDGYPYSRLRGSFTPLPSAMAIGATWESANAERVGEIVGQELAAVGVNMLLGPVVDVLNNPRLSTRGDIGIRAFGGDPYWVGEMGRAYIRGVHRGSQGRVLTVAKHFPGHGGSDRLPDEEVSTVDKSFQELRRIELPPFFRVTQLDDTDDSATTDGVMTSHIRYRGFQGDIRQFTPPISFDPVGMKQLLALPEFARWRETGLIVSDSLGVPAVRRYFDPQELTFPAKQIAKEAFLAGNDVLILAQFDLKNIWANQLINMKATIDFFVSEYRANPTFRRRVDEAVVRILGAKQRLYGDFDLAGATVSPEGIGPAVHTDEANATVARIAQEAITLIHPRRQAGRDSQPISPRREDIIVIVSDDAAFQACFEKIPECASQPVLEPTAFADAMLRLYGPDGSGQIAPENVHNLTFSQLRSFLTAPFSEPSAEGTAPPEATPTPTPPPAPEYIPEPEADVGTLIATADWIVFVMLDMNTQRFEAADAVRVFLDVGPRSYDKQIVAIALNAPYRLDTTEINKLSAYYAAYSKTPACIEAAVRAMFGELVPAGASPVSIEGTGYDLTEQLAPNPEHEIPLVLIEPDDASKVTEFPTTVHVQTGRVLDHNGNVVPDSTQVNFVFERDEGEVLGQVATGTRAGIAEAQFTVSLGGPLYIRASSVQATSGRPYRVDFRAPTPTPTSTPTVTPPPTATPTVAPTSTAAATHQPLDAVPTGTAGTAAETGEGEAVASMPAGTSPGAAGLILAFLAVALAGGAGMAVSQAAAPAQRVRPLLLGAVTGLAGYVMYASGWLEPAVTVSGSPWLAGAIALVFAGATATGAVVRSRRRP